MKELKHNLRVEPYEYQREGILFGLERHRLLIGDEPGLGKTLQSIGIVDTASAYPCLVICPSSLKINWQREFEKFTDKRLLCLTMPLAHRGRISSAWVCSMLLLSIMRV